MISRLCIITCCITAITSSIIKQADYLSYEDARNSVIEAEDMLSTGGRLKLNSWESKVDTIFLKYKYNELKKGAENPEMNAAGMHFFKAKPLIDKSKIFKFLQKMPKGAVLHSHNSATVSSDWVVKNISYMPGLLRCTTKEGVNILTFRQLPETHACATHYVKVSDERKNSSSIRDYDKALEGFINLYTASPELEYTNINKVWTKFEKMFKTLGDVLQYLPVYRAYHWQMLEELYNDNVMYAEIRMSFHELYDIEGRTYPAEVAAAEIISVNEKFKAQHPQFLGIKLIHSVGRRVENRKMQQDFELFKKLHFLYPNYIVGFDLVGQEDLGKPLHNFVDILRDKPKTSKFFFHAGETNWYGASTDYNLLDAMLLNTTRIGHGYALMKHPILYNAVKTRDIAVEVSPISNQVLELVWDLRNHPGSFFVSQNIPIVICNDDPGFWNSKALSYDFYYAIMSFASNHAGLKTLKQLVWNSIKYSTMNPTERQRAFAMLQNKWSHFLDDVLNGVVI